MKKTLSILTTLLLITWSAWAAPINYEKLIQDACKKAETGKAVESWRMGMLEDYKLIFDHLGITYKKIQEATTTDGKELVCGTITVTGYGKTEDGIKKRIVEEKNLCHLFNGEEVEKITKISETDLVVLNGWDEAILI